MCLPAVALEDSTKVGFAYGKDGIQQYVKEYP